MADANLTNWQNATDNRFEYGKKAYLEATPDLASANSMAQGVSGLQAKAAVGQADLATDLNGRVDKFSGLQDQYAADAFGMNSQAKQDQVSGQASAEVANKFAGLRAQGLRQQSRMGVNPSSGRALAMNNQMGIEEAAASAGASNKARQDLDVIANDRQKTAIGFGANAASQSNSAAQMAGYLGNQAGTSAAAPLSNKLAFTGGISNLYGNAADGYKSIWQSTNLTAAQQANVNAADQASSNSSNNALMGAIGSIAGSKTGEKYIDKGLTYLFG